MSATPRTDEVATEVSALAAQWKSKEISLKQWCELAQAEFDKLGELEKRLAIAEGGLDAAYLSGFHKRDDEVRELLSAIKLSRDALAPIFELSPGGDIGWRGQKSAICGNVLVRDVLNAEKAMDAIKNILKGDSNA